MAFFDDMNEALESYPETDVQLEFEDVSFPGDVLNVNETGTFKVRVTNTGPLRLSGVTLRIKGLNGTTVKNNGAISPYVTEFVTQVIPGKIGAHGGSEVTTGSALGFKAPAGAQALKNLVKVTLEDWDADLDHIMLAHSDPLRTVKATYAAEVVGS